MLRFLAWIGIVDAVWLFEGDGEPHLTIKRKHPNGGYYANVNWFVQVGYVNLHEDGTCTGSSCYIKSWKDF